MGKVISDLKGTASELFENRAYDQLVEKVGEDGALRAILSKLNERNISVPEWQNYRKVREVMHRTPLGINETLKEVDDLSNGCLE